MKYLLASAICALGLAAVPGTSQAQVEPFLAQIMIFAGNFCPLGWLKTNGALLPISQYQALFALIGTLYGGNGTTDFALPNTQPIFTQTRQTFTECIAIEGVFPSRG
jgi:microcystin-dependent protein